MIPANLSSLANHLWQSTLFAAVTWLLTLVLRKNRAAVRYGLWLVASLKFLVPFSILVSAGSQFAWRPSPAIGPAVFSRAVEQISQPFPLQTDAVPLGVAAPSWNPVPVILLSVWLCGFFISAAVWLRWWRRFRAAIRIGTPLDFDL